VQLVVETLLTTKEPLSSFEGISNQDVKELLVDNEGNLGAWLGARKAVAALGLLPEVAGVLSKSGYRSEVGDSSRAHFPLLCCAQTPWRLRAGLISLSRCAGNAFLCVKRCSQTSSCVFSQVALKANELRAVTSRILDAEVKSAVPLSKEQQDAVTKALPKYAEAGQSLNVTFSVDSAVLGGLLVTMKNQTIDLSATSRLVEVVSAAGGAQ
jgi:hypothetical protein